MKPASIRKTVKIGGLYIHVREYSDQRFGFDLKKPGEPRQQVRRWKLADAIQAAKEAIGEGRAGRLDLLGIKQDDLMRFLRWEQEQQRKCPALKKLIETFLAEKKSLLDKKELSYAHYKGIDGTLSKLRDAFDWSVRIDQIDRKSVEDWLNGQNIGPRSFNNRRSHLIALVRYARGHRWVGQEPIPIEAIPKRKATVTVETFTPDEMKRLLLHVPEEWRPAIVLGGFCGVRPEELCPDPNSHKPPLRWENFLWAKGKIDMPANVSKDGRRRFVPICDAAMAWLAPWRNANATGRTVPAKRLDNQPRTWKTKSGVEWKKDGLRHSYASYRLAMRPDIGALSEEMGNSPRMIRTHYLDIKHEEEAAEWFGLTPEKLGIAVLPENVVQFG